MVGIMRLINWIRKKKENDGIPTRRPGEALTSGDKAKRLWVAVRSRMVPWMSWALLLTTIAVPVGIFVWLLLYTDIFVVQAVTVVDAREHTLEQVREIVEAGVENVPLGKNIFLVQSQVLESEVKNKLPQVRDVYVTRKLPGTIKVIIQEKTPFLLLLSNGAYYFVDSSGVPYEEARLETLPGVVLPIVKDSGGQTEVTLGVPAVDEGFVNFLTDIQSELPKYAGSEVAEIRIPSLAAREVHFMLNNNMQVRFDVTRSAESQLNILQELVTSTIPEDERGNLEYIDLRIPNRVYYRPR